MKDKLSKSQFVAQLANKKSTKETDKFGKDQYKSKYYGRYAEKKAGRN